MVRAGGNERLKCLPARARVVKYEAVLRLAGRDLGEARLERVRLHLRRPHRGRCRARSPRASPRPCTIDVLAVERPGRVAEVDVARDGRRVARAAEDPGDRLVVLLLVQVGASSGTCDRHRARVRGRDRLGVEVGGEQLRCRRAAARRRGRLVGSGSALALSASAPSAPPATTSAAPPRTPRLRRSALVMETVTFARAPVRFDDGGVCRLSARASVPLQNLCTVGAARTRVAPRRAGDQACTRRCRTVVVAAFGGTRRDVQGAFARAENRLEARAVIPDGERSRPGARGVGGAGVALRAACAWLGIG